MASSRELSGVLNPALRTSDLRGNGLLSKLPAGRRLESLASLIWSELRQQWLFVVIALAYVAGVCSVAHGIGRPRAVAISLYSPVMLVLLVVSLLAFALGHMLYLGVVVRPERPLRRIAEDWGSRFQVPQRISAALPILLVLPLFMSAFTSMKIMIPQLNPFSWDPTFAAWDRWVHGGVDPWRLLQPFLGHPAATVILNLLYHKWFLVVNGVLVWQAFSMRDRCLRQQFFLAFILTWIMLGTGMALLVPAAGPCYYGRITGVEQDPFQPLMSYLRSVHDQGLNPAFTVQEWLWQQYSTNSIILGGGISAMPSMHVALATLFVLLGFRHSQWLGWMMTFFGFSILLGSIQLGWHYAIDGYAAIGGTFVIWSCAAFLTRNATRKNI